MFRLLRYFSINSLIAILISVIILGMFYRHFASRDMLNAAEDRNLILTQLFSNTLWPKYSSFLEKAHLIPSDELLAHPVLKELRNDVIAQVKGTSVLKVKIFSLGAKTIFSTEEKQIGVIKDANYRGSISAQTGKIISVISHRDTFNAIGGVLSNRDIVSSYLPIRRSHNSKVEAVIEVYTDVTGLHQSIKRTQLDIVLYVFLVLAFLYATLFLIVRHADKLLKKQYTELNEVNNKLHETQSQLEDAVDIADSANEAKSRFLANMSHEIRTPLTAIIGFTEASLSSDQTKEERLSALNTIMRSGKHLVHVINQVLDVSKIEANQLDIESIPVNPINILRDVEEIFKKNVIEKNVTFDTKYIYPLPQTIHTDPVRLEQILINLCSNAFKFTDEGSINIEFSYSAENKNIMFSVIDTGIGMNEEQLNQVFQPFKQADTSITRQYGGTGLGLSLSRSLAHKLGGELEVKSKPDEGTRFDLILDIRNESDLNLIVDAAHHVKTPQTDDTLSPMKQLKGNILVAEDNEDNQRLLTLFLNRMGVNVTIAENGQQAVEQANSDDFDLVYMDMQMPVMSGIEAVKLLRDQGYKKPIVALTANATTQDKSRCIAAGCDDFLSKPVVKNDLHEMSSRYLQIAELKNNNEEPISSEFLDEDPDYLILIERYVAELPDQLTKIINTYETKNWPDLKVAIHNMKGSGSGFGYPKLTEITGKIEFQLLNENFPIVASLINELEATCERIYKGMTKVT